MKKILFLGALIISALISQPANAQVGVSINIGMQPVWGPIGYDYVNYYYLPDVDAYYDVPSHVYVYREGGVWVRRPSLPPAFAGYDLYHGYKVVINDREPWLNHTVYHDKYVGYRGRHDQVVIRDSREPRYYEVKEHPMHGQWHPDNHPVEHREVNHPVDHQGGQNHPVEHGNKDHGNKEHK